MKIAYCDCFSGISGDMFLGALLDAGLPLETLQGELAKLHLPDPYEIRAEKVMRGAIQATLLQFALPGEESEAEDLHQHPHVHDHEHAHTSDHSHEHGDEHAHDHHHEHHQSIHVHQRTYAEIRALICASGVKDEVKATSLAIFQKLAEAEGTVHGVPAEEVHFHEVGALDSILDIVGAAIGLNALGIEKVFASALPWGGGQVNTQHGTLPLPAPATLELLAAAQAPLMPSPAKVELVTPTGAAILAALANFEQPAMRLGGVGVGAGKRELPWANVMRILLGESELTPSGATVLLETNIDDQSPQALGYVMSRLFAAGALDVYFTPIQMKKNRPAVMLSVICRKADEGKLAEILLRETSTFGLRVQQHLRYEAGRHIIRVETEFGAVEVKLKEVEGRVVWAAPEYEACRRVAEQSGVEYMEVYLAAQQAARGLVER